MLDKHKHRERTRLYYSQHADEIKARARAHRLENGDLVRQREHRYRLRKKYGMTVREHEDMLRKQNGKCALPACDRAAVCVDHDHSTGRVRALLCRECNSALGYFRDNATLMRDAAVYVEKYRE